MNQAKQRKSRRSHKNSRDGCPNCKRKRIKCSEELPQCFNCIKKNDRCGYLDFPKDKLNHIRNKNENKRKEELFKKLSRDQELSNLPNSLDELNNSISYHNQNSNNNNNNNNSYNGSISFQPETTNENHNSISSMSSTSGSLNDSRLRSKSNASIFSNHNSISSTSGSSSNSLNSKDKQLLINEAFNNIHNEFASNLFKMDNTNYLNHNQTNFNYFDYVPDYSQQQPFKMQDQSEVREINMGEISPGGVQPDLGPTESEGQLQSIPMNVNQFSEYDLMMDFDSNFNSNQFVNFDNSNFNLLKIQSLNNSNNNNNTSNNNNINTNHNNYYNNANFYNNVNGNSNYINGKDNYNNEQSNHLINQIHQINYLPNATDKVAKFKTIRRKPKVSLKPYYFIPVFNNKFYAKVWHELFEESINNEIIQSFLLDKSLGILLSNLNIVLTSDYLKNFHNTYHTLDEELNFENDFFFNEKVLNKLIAKSYNYYNNLIKNIRDNLNNYHIEYTIKISLLSSYSSFFLLNSSVDTLVTLNSGASSLMYKFVNEVNDYSQLTVCIKYMMDLLFNHVQYSKVPNLPFELIEVVFENFKIFKKFLINSTSLYQSLQNSQTIRDFLPKHDCIEFENFLTYLMYNFLPKIKQMNQAYREESDEFKIVSYNLIFELVNKWFKMYPSIVNTVSSKLNVLQRVFYLFFIVVGKLLNQVFTPIRSIMNIDCINVLYSVVEFNYSSFKVNKFDDKLNNEQYTYLNKLNKNLLRLISFCNYRTLFYGHYLSNELSVMDEEFLRKIDGDNDYVEILSSKVDFNEKPLIISPTLEFTMKFENFPQFPEYRNYQYFHDSKLQDIDHHQPQNEPSTEDDIYRDDNFNYELGLFKNDFNPTNLVVEFLKMQKVKYEFEGVKMSNVKLRCKNLNHSRKIIAKSVNGFKTCLD